jgi:hypothetical protein
MMDMKGALFFELCSRALLSNLGDGSLTGSPRAVSPREESKGRPAFLVQLLSSLGLTAREESQEQATLLRLLSSFSRAARRRPGA